MDISTQLEKVSILRFNSRIQNLSETAERLKTNPAADQKLKETTQEFASLLIHYMMKAMRATVPKDGLLRAGQTEAIFADMLDQEIAKAASQRGIGIADLLYQQLRD